MIKFFRHIRKTLLGQNKMGKYFKYAIGEIILVVIGILIALQVNNLNEKRKVRNEITKKMEALVENLESEILVSGVWSHPKRISDYQKLLDGKLTIDSLQTNPEYVKTLNNFTTYIKDDVLEETIDILIENEDRLPKDYKEIISLMKSLKFYFSNFKKLIQVINELRRNNKQILENNYTWYALNDSISNKQRFEYYLTDPLFKNRLHTFLEVYRTGYRIYSTFIARKLEILCAIKLLDKNYSADKLTSYLSSNDFFRFEPFLLEAKKVTCEQKPKSELHIASSHLIVNMSKDTIEIKDSKLNGKKIIPPNRTDFYESRIDDIIKVEKNNMCIAYRVSPLNFIIVE